MAGPPAVGIAPGPHDPAGDRRGQLATWLRRGGDRSGAGRVRPAACRAWRRRCRRRFCAPPEPHRRVRAASARPTSSCASMPRSVSARAPLPPPAAPRPRHRPAPTAGWPVAAAICRSSAAASACCFACGRGQHRRFRLPPPGSPPRAAPAPRAAPSASLTDLLRQAAQHQHAAQRVLRLAPAPPAASRPGTATAARSPAAAAASFRRARPGPPAPDASPPPERPSAPPRRRWRPPPAAVSRRPRCAAGEALRICRRGGGAGGRGLLRRLFGGARLLGLLHLLAGRVLLVRPRRLRGDRNQRDQREKPTPPRAPHAARISECPVISRGCFSPISSQQRRRHVGEPSVAAALSRRRPSAAPAPGWWCARCADRRSRDRASARNCHDRR